MAGGEIVATYAHFLRTGDEGALLGVVEHNAADVLSMVALVGLYGEPLGVRGETEDEAGAVYTPANLDGADLAGVARTLRQAGALDRAAALAEAAVAREGAPWRGGRGETSRRRAGTRRGRSPTTRRSRPRWTIPAVRLELAKLYEHHVRAFAEALALAAQGTGEDEAATERRRSRLTRRLAKAR